MTSYTIKKSDASILVELAEGQTDNASSSLTLVGKNVYNFGQSQNNNLVHLLENFAFNQPPASPTTGQLWFNTSNNSLNVFKNNNWGFVPDMTVTPPLETNDTTETGALMFNSATGQLFVKNGSAYTLIGPTATPGYGQTQIVSTLIYGTEVPTSLPHAVLECIVGDQVVAIISPSLFNINSTNSIPNFTSVYPGITLSSAYNTIAGTSTKSNQLLNGAGNMYIASSTNIVNNSIVERDESGNISANRLATNDIFVSNSILATGQVSADSISTANIYGDGALFGNWVSNGDISPSTNFGSDLGSVGVRWGAIHSQTVTADRVVFAALVDAASNSVTGFDTDITLSSDSDNLLGTQKAVKTYVDASAYSLQQQLSALQNQVNNLQLIPSGTVLFTAGLSAPAGFLIAAGQALSKSVYSALYAVIGGTYGQSSDKFNLPDLRGQFIRGFDSGAGIDPGRTLGSTQNDDFKSHDHATKVHRTQKSDNSTNWMLSDPDIGENINGTVFLPSTFTGGTETRPTNIAMIGIIKY